MGYLSPKPHHLLPFRLVEAPNKPLQHRLQHPLKQPRLLPPRTQLPQPPQNQLPILLLPQQRNTRQPATESASETEIRLHTRHHQHTRDNLILLLCRRKCRHHPLPQFRIHNILLKLVTNLLRKKTPVDTRPVPVIECDFYFLLSLVRNETPAQLFCMRVDEET
ncbi:hypothetical protein JMJ35_004527 [Cladonia borealis]|uniref:Uncharacterized protein n=1 Tax=Cladonia borealis TaxID=184061 RepID=A0AA39R2E8_9LECA|nr:hypothetical protein JMJ35_004527 [Cladonia borealis]